MYCRLSVATTVAGAAAPLNSARPCLRQLRWNSSLEEELSWPGKSVAVAAVTVVDLSETRFRFVAEASVAVDLAELPLIVARLFEFAAEPALNC